MGPIQRLRTLILIAIAAFFLASCGISLFVAHRLSEATLKNARESFEAQANLLEQAVIGRFEKPVQALKGLAALHRLEQSFSKKRFHDYWEARGFQQDFPGVRGFGYIAHVAPAQLDAFLASERRDQGADFRIKTLGPVTERYIIKLIEPIEQNRSAIGLDIGSERVRRTAADEAMRSGLPTLSGVITLLQDGRQGPGFLLLLPTYRSGAELGTQVQRQASHLGFVYSPLVAEELFQPLLLNALGQMHFDIEVRSPHDPAQWVFQSERFQQETPTSAERQPADEPLFTTNRHFLVAGLEFRLLARSSKAFDATVDTQQAWRVAVGGVAFSALLSFVLWLLVSGRARAEARARELSGEMSRLAVVAERTSNSVIIADAEHRIVWVNRAFTALSGQTLDEVRGRKTSDFRGDIQDPRTLDRIRAALQKGEGLRIETVNQSRDGRTFWVDLDLQTLRDADGRYQGYVAVERDITDSKLALEREHAHAEQLAAALRETDALMNTINAHAIVSEAGRDGRILRVNSAFCRISGYSAEELVGQDHRIINSGLQDKAFWQDIWRTISSGQAWHGQICNRAKDGSLYWVDSIIAPFMDASGRVEKYVSIRFDITQARETEQELARERKRLSSTLEGTNIGTWEVNVITGESRIDERFAGMLGYTLQELFPFNQEKWQALAHPDDEKMARSLRQDYLRGLTEKFEVEQRLKHKDGHWIWVLSRGIISARLPDGRAEWTLGTHMEVTERHLLQEALEQRNELMSAIMENIPGGLSAFDADLNLLVRNTQFSGLLELPESLLSQTPTTFESIIRFNAERGDYGPGDVDQTVAAIVERARNPTPHVLERTRPNGMVLEVRGLPLPGGGFVTTYTDITQRKNIEKEARRADEMLRQAINTLDEAFVIYDDQDRLLICNQRYKDTYPIAAALMEPGNTFEHIIRYGAERGEYALAIGRVDEWVAERMRQHRSGDTDVVQELGDGRYLRIVERKTAEGYTVGFRIDITALMRARMAAEEASKSKSQFLANMSHEIRTPMNAILGMLHLLHNTELSTRQLDYVNKTEGAAKSLLALLNDILDFSKVEAGKMTLETAPFRIDHLMRDLSVILSSNTGSKNVEVLFDVDRSLPASLLGDSLRLKQVLINLGGNAVKFTEKGMVVLRIAVLEVQASHVTLEFSVRDTGIGIAPENLQRIFEGFLQAEASTTRRFGGTGLGLVISARLVGLMGGQLKVESEVGKGSRFHFQITLGVAQDDAPAIEAPAQAELRELQVLVIDDNPLAQQVLQAMVEPMGWQAELASSGEEALALIRQRIASGQRPHDAVFVDWQMPGMDGWETSLEIRKLLSGQDAPILVMVTAHGREMLAQRPAGEQALLNGFVVKPATPSMLVDAIMEARQVRQGGAARRTTAAASAHRLQGMRVLLVEDNKINQQVAQELLEREGALVTLADNGELGVQAIEAAQTPWDVVLMDVQMPVMDGYTATRKVRQELKLTSLPIIAMTANAMESDRLEALAAGMNAHVGKPFNLDELVGAMLQHSGYVAPEAGAVAALPSPQAPRHAPASLVNTAEFDITSALERLGGNAPVLARILQTFGRDLPRQPQELAAMLAQGQGADSRRLLHTLKGTAATVGAHRLAAIAAEAEHRLREGSVPAGEEARLMLERLSAAVDAVTADLMLALRQLQPEGNEAGPANSTPVDRGALQADLDRLMTLLRNSDLASLDVYAQLRDRHGAALNEALETLDEAMAGLDFSQAAELCEQLQQRYTD
ncbi:MAG: PAS-domain containing protein [Hylemonella sp.]|nr:PAS-domain containing protein [Hylemonella sp.]